MNERIKELMPKPWTFPYPDREMYSKEQMEKFAELIVRDCIKIVEGYCETTPEIFGLPLDILEHFDMEIDDEF